MKDITTEEAIKDLKSLVEEYKDCSVEGLNMQVDVGFNEERCKNLEKVLNELETLQNGFNTAVEHQTELIRENSHLRYELFNNQKELKEKDKIIKNQSYTNKKMRKKLDGYRKLLKLKERHLSKKDKIIDAMIDEYEYNVRINIKNYCDDEIRKDACIQDCENCIKQYFEQEVKDERR